MRILLLLAAASAAAHAQPTLIEILESKLVDEVKRLEARETGVAGFAAFDLTTQRMFSYHGDTQFAQASSIKIPIMMAMFRTAAGGKFQLTDKVTLTAREAVGGSGHLRERLLVGPVILTIKEVITAMMETSDNTATNHCIRMVGMEAVNRTLADYGMKKTRLQRVMMDSGAARGGAENIATPEEMARLAALLHQGKAVTPAASAEMLDILRLVKAHFKKAIPGVDIASKPGGIPGVKCETGVVYLKNRPYALSVMTSFVPDSSDMVERVAAMIHGHFVMLSKSNSYGNRTEP
ncbi:MAG: serine hydrolase [Acidobacteria bacterium]|nr:serine hydrolase [Acidobacteriota bacterium]